MQITLALLVVLFSKIAVAIMCVIGTGIFIHRNEMFHVILFIICGIYWYSKIDISEQMKLDIEQFKKDNDK